MMKLHIAKLHQAPDLMESYFFKLQNLGAYHMQFL